MPIPSLAKLKELGCTIRGRAPVFILFAAGSLALTGVSGCSSSAPPWKHTDEFVHRLRCGMPIFEVESIAEGYRGLKLREIRHWPPWDYVAVKNGTHVQLDFSEGGLRQVQVSWVDTILHREFLPAQDLCVP